MQRSTLAAMAMVWCGALLGCSAPASFVKEPQADVATSTIRFHRARDVIGSSGASFTIADMGEGVPANGVMIADLGVNPYRLYRESGTSHPNLSYLSGPQPVRGALSMVAVDARGAVRAAAAQGEATVWGGTRAFEGLMQIAQRVTISPDLPPLVAEPGQRLAPLTLQADERSRLAATAPKALAGQLLFTFYAAKGCRTFAASFSEALHQCATPVQVVGSTGHGSEGLSWKRPPGKMRLLVVSPHVATVCDQGELVVEAGKTYDIEFDSSTGSFKVTP